MIKDPKKFFKKDEEARIAYLRRLSIRESVKILQAILSSRLMMELIFKKDDHPIALSKMVSRY